MLQRLVQRFNTLTIGKKIIIAIVVFGLLILMSPLTVLLAALAMFVALVVIVVQAFRQQPARKWAAALGVSFVALLVFSGISAAIYGGVPEETASEEPAATQEEIAPEPTREETTRQSPVPEDTEEIEQEQQDAPNREREEAEPQEAVRPQPRPAPPPEPTPQERLAERGQVVTVTRAVDGDTVEISPLVNGIEDVRLIGVDTPEMSSDCGTQPLANEATNFTSTQLVGQKVALELGAESVDMYDRLLGYVWKQDGSMFNQALLANGLAQVYTVPPNDKYETRFFSAQQRAANAGLGIWGLANNQQLLQNERGNGIGGGCVAVPEPQPVPQEPAPQPAPAPSAPVTPSVPAGGDLDCADFSSLAEVQQSLAAGDPHGLDADGDGRACESNF